MNNIFYRFDFEAIGKSPGKKEEISVGKWIEDLRCVVQNLVPEKVLLVGSSMGGWVSIHNATTAKDNKHETHKKSKLSVYILNSINKKHPTPIIIAIAFCCIYVKFLLHKKSFLSLQFY